MIYLDNNATAQLDPQVLQEMLPLMEQLIGNPSSIHRFGQKSKGLLVDSLRSCATFFGVRQDEIVFTSGASEALNFLIKAIPRGRRIITSSLEHPALLEPIKHSGLDAVYLDPLPGSGTLSAEQIEEVLDANCVIALGAANHETGIMCNLDRIARLGLERGVPLIIDGVALLGKGPCSLPNGVLAACFSGHKIHGPLGIAVALIRRPFKAPALILGGPQQGGRRAGTENLPAIVGFAKALELLEERSLVQMQKLRDRLEEGLAAEIGDLVIHGKGQMRLSNTSNCAFPGVDGEALIMALDLHGVAASYGSACSAGALSISRTLLAMGIAPELARSSVRFSLSRFTTADEIERAIQIIAVCIKQLRK